MRSANRKQRHLGVRALVSVALLAAAGCDGPRRSAASRATVPAGRAGVPAVTVFTGRCPAGLTIGFLGPLTGIAAASIGEAQSNAVQLAIDQFNSAHPACSVSYRGIDSQTGPSTAVAQAIVDRSLLAVVGPAQDSEAQEAEMLFNTADVATITASATDPSLAAHHWSVFHRAVANDNTEGPAAADFMVNGLKAKKVAIVDDGSARGRQLAGVSRQQLQVRGITVVSPPPITNPASDASAVTTIAAANVDAVFFAGGYHQAAALAHDLKTAGFTAAFVSDDQALDPAFIEAATPSGAEGAYFLSPIAHALTQSADQPFVAAYRAKRGAAPSLYAAEAYDAANELLAAIAAGNFTRSEINTYVSTTSYHGVLRTYSYAANGELRGTPPILIHRVIEGRITLVGAVSP